MAKLVKCKTCGAEIAKTAKCCPHCGARQHTGAYSACVIIVLFTVIACVFVLISGQKNETPVNTPTSTSTVSFSPVSSETFDEIGNVFSEAFPDSEITVRKRDKRFDVVAAVSGITADAQPDGWNTTLQTLCNATVSACDAIAENDAYSIKDIASQIVADDGTILATVYNGKAVYDAYRPKAELEEENNNRATITQHEFDSISIGMRYSQVVDIIGGDGDLYLEVGSAGSLVGDYKSYIWYGEGLFPGRAILSFQDYELYSKVAYGLT